MERETREPNLSNYNPASEFGTTVTELETVIQDKHQHRNIVNNFYETRSLDDYIMMIW